MDEITLCKCGVVSKLQEAELSKGAVTHIIKYAICGKCGETVLPQETLDVLHKIGFRAV